MSEEVVMSLLVLRCVHESYLSGDLPIEIINEEITAGLCIYNSYNDIIAH